jgi:NADH dehydrogenase
MLSMECRSRRTSATGPPKHARSEAESRNCRGRVRWRCRRPQTERRECRCSLIDRRNHNIFQPLLYQVATAVLAPSDVAAPIRQLARGQPNLTVLMGEMTGIGLSDRTITTTCVDGSEFKQRFDYLVIAAGMRPSYFGHDEFAAYAPSLKTISDPRPFEPRSLPRLSWLK